MFPGASVGAAWQVATVAVLQLHSSAILRLALTMAELCHFHIPNTPSRPTAGCVLTSASFP